jgi:ferritin-like metal-binding protein YciE
MTKYQTFARFKTATRGGIFYMKRIFNQVSLRILTSTRRIIMELATLQDLYVEELKDLYSAETQIVEALPKMSKAATDPKLKESFNLHLQETQEQVRRLEKIFGKLGEPPTGKTCTGMKGIIAEGSEILKEDAAPEVRDAGLISAAQRVEHYEMAGYGTVRTYAEQLGEKDAVKLLEETLEEERETDKKLTKLATSTIIARADR